MKPQTRVELVDLLPPNALVIELGVAAGNFAAEMLARNATMSYIGVDRWCDHHNESEMRQASIIVSNAAIDRMDGISKNIIIEPTLLHMSFSDAVDADLISEVFPDLIYIDGYAHTGQEGGETIRDWWPKLKPGGIFAGHDYDAKEYPQTVAAVDEFVAQHGLQLNLTCENRLPSWWVKKP